MSVIKQVLLCVLLAGAGLAGWYAYQNPHMVGLAHESAGDGAARAGGAGSRIPGLIGGGAVNVITATVETDAGAESVLALGTAKAARAITVYPQVTGIVTEILFTPGQAVAAGDTLLRLEDDEQRVAVDRAGVALEQARDTLTRSQTLAQSRTISSVALSDAETAAKMAEIELRSAEIALDRRTVNAPFDGMTGLTDISIGDLISTSTAITTLDDLSTVRVGFEAPERWGAKVREGQAIKATAQGLPGSEFAGRITGIDNRVDQATRTLRLEAELDNSGQALKAGMAITVELAFDSGDRLAVPTLSIQWDRRGSFVWKVSEGVARRAPITILRRESGVVIVEGAVEAGEKVVVEGIQRLREGAKVTEVGVEPTIVEEEVEGMPEATPSAEEETEPTVSGAGNPQRVRS